MKAAVLNKYVATPGAHISDDDAQLIGDAIDAGHSTPAALVKASKPKRSPTHHLFDWDVEKAAQRAWEQDARYLMRSVAIVLDEESNKTMRAFHNVNVAIDEEEEPRREYVPMDRVRSTVQLREQVLEEAARQLKSWRARHALYKRELGEVFTAAEKVERKYLNPKRAAKAVRKK